MSSTRSLPALLLVAGAGAGLYYLFDPRRGDERRARLSQQATNLWDDARNTVQNGAGESGAKDGSTSMAANTSVPSAAPSSPSGGGLLGGLGDLLHGSIHSGAGAKRSPASRLLAGAVGALFALYGRRRKDALGNTLHSLGMSLVTREVSGLLR
jgi:hypothetical protein